MIASNVNGGPRLFCTTCMHDDLHPDDINAVTDARRVPGQLERGGHVIWCHFQVSDAVFLAQIFGEDLTVDFVFPWFRANSLI